MLPQSWVHTMEVILVRLHLYNAKNNVITTGEGKIYQKSSEVAPVDETNCKSNFVEWGVASKIPLNLSESIVKKCNH